MTEYELVDEPPPPRVYRRDAWRAEFVEFLRAHPGKWAIAPKAYRKATAYALASALREMGCDATTRIEDDDKNYQIYARWPT